MMGLRRAVEALEVDIFLRGQDLLQERKQSRWQKGKKQNETSATRKKDKG